MAASLGYSRAQILLHWVVAALIVPQFLLSEGISQAFDAFLKRGEVAFSPMVAAHVIGGALIGLLVLWRLSLRATRGAPPPPEAEQPALKLLAKLVHGLLYVVLLLLPISGAVAWFGGIEAAGEAHEVIKAALMALVVLHVIGALYHQFVLKTNLMARMKTPM